MTTLLRLDGQEYAFNNPDDEWKTRQSTKRPASDEEDDSDPSCVIAMDTTSDEIGHCSNDQKDRTKKHCKYMIGNRVLNILMKADQDASHSQCEEMNNKEQPTSNEVILSGGDCDVLQEDRQCVNCSQIIEVMMDGEPYMDQSVMMFECEFCDKDVCSECALECGICHQTFCRFCAIQRYDHDLTALCFTCQS